MIDEERDFLASLGMTKKNGLQANQMASILHTTRADNTFCVLKRQRARICEP